MESQVSLYIGDCGLYFSVMPFFFPFYISIGCLYLRIRNTFISTENAREM